jgi:hypothetical protein
MNSVFTSRDAFFGEPCHDEFTFRMTARAERQVGSPHESTNRPLVVRGVAFISLRREGKRKWHIPHYRPGAFLSAGTQ